jgi:hypothetical protein
VVLPNLDELADESGSEVAADQLFDQPCEASFIY